MTSCLDSFPVNSNYNPSQITDHSLRLCLVRDRRKHKEDIGNARTPAPCRAARTTSGLCSLPPALGCPPACVRTALFCIIYHMEQLRSPSILDGARPTLWANRLERLSAYQRACPSPVPYRSPGSRARAPSHQPRAARCVRSIFFTTQISIHVRWSMPHSLGEPLGEAVGTSTRVPQPRAVPLAWILGPCSLPPARRVRSAFFTCQA